MDEQNIFRAAAKALWLRGEDGKIIARDLAHALAWVIREGLGQDADVNVEFTRLLGLE